MNVWREPPGVRPSAKVSLSRIPRTGGSCHPTSEPRSGASPASQGFHARPATCRPTSEPRSSASGLSGFPRTGGGRRPTSEPWSLAAGSPQREDEKDEEHEEVKDEGQYTAGRGCAGAQGRATPHAAGATARGRGERPASKVARSPHELPGLKRDSWARRGCPCGVTGTPRSATRGQFTDLPGSPSRASVDAGLTGRRGLFLVCWVAAA